MQHQFIYITILEKRMSIGNKINLSGLLVIITTVASAMEQRPLAIPSKSSPEVGLSAYLYDKVSGSFDSLSNTVTNACSDYAAFKKLGWPPSDPVAQQELERSKAIYEKVNKSIQTQILHETFLEDCNAITRRNAICQRVLVALDNYPDAINLALFCINHHRRILNEFDLSRFLAFVNKEQEKSNKGAQDVYKELSRVMVLPNDNELLNRFVKQSISGKETELSKEIVESKKDVESKKNTGQKKDSKK